MARGKLGFRKKERAVAKQGPDRFSKRAALWVKAGFLPRRLSLVMIPHMRVSKSHFLMTIQGLYDPFNRVRKRYTSPTELKLKVYEAYGNKCACCGENRIPFLSIDHIYRDGALERKTIAAGPTLYRHLERSGFPKDRYRLLCMNCNFAQRYGEPCPHVMKGKEAKRCIATNGD